jgi:pSer/pThr/pTyr-binding forkhead associated (FHA) protein
MAKLYILNGPEIGRSFKLADNLVYVGRGSDNDIQIVDSTVSRKHVRIERRGSRYFISDLGSRNGTFFNGNYIAPGLELEVKEGVPIVIGMSVICLGRSCKEQIMPFLDSIELTRQSEEDSGIFEVHRDKTNQRKLELLYKVSNPLSENLQLNALLEKILGYIFQLLGRIDRGAFILVDPETERIADVVSSSYKPGDESPTLYCTDVVRRVIEDRKPVVISNVHVVEGDELADTLKILRIESVMCLPLISSSQIMGAMYFDSLGRTYGFSAEDVALFVDVGQRIAATIENVRLTWDSTMITDQAPSTG